jgi:predicted transcriptional regulator
LTNQVTYAKNRAHVISLSSSSIIRKPRSLCAFEYFDHTMVGKMRKWGMAMADSNIHVSEELLAELQKAAAAEQRTADEVAQEAVERYLRLKRREKLYAYGEEQARKLGIQEEDVPGLVKQSRQSTPRGR